ncbi:MAG: polyphosphate:AMP phosphotransferase [Eubacteriales bacterium]|nr:polyphosphate:AMP phosphotransferase [Eubacteriales bacterium]
MIQNAIFPSKPEDVELKERLKAAQNKLFTQQMLLKNHKVPVLVLMEGWGTAGKGSLIGNIIQNIDPRFFKVFSMDAPSSEERRKPFLFRYFEKIPEAGKFVFMDSGWMDEVVVARISGKMNDRLYEQRIASIKRFERQLTDNGYLVLKFFCHVSQKEQKKRIESLLESKDTRWRVSKNDAWQNKHYEKYMEVFDKYLEDTNTSAAPWYMVDAKSRKWAELQILEIITQGIEVALQNQSLAVPLLQNVFPMVNMPKLSEISLDNCQMDDASYKAELNVLQKRLGELHNRLYRKKVPVVVAYEGWDAAGKGGNIKRITGALDPRGYEVHPIASPEPHEKARHYLWRFWTRLPKTGHIAIFDRTWYGRVMVERIEGFCSENDWKRAYNEINEFEKELSDWGAVIIKFWVHIDKDTQLARFTDRQNTPEKQWKITDEDWRNREKWDQYETAVNEMIQKTSTSYAPWHVLESVDKKYARIKALRIVIDELEKVLGEKK